MYVLRVYFIGILIRTLVESVFLNASQISDLLTNPANGFG